MDNKLDVFEILGVNNNKDKEKDQEQAFVPDLDLTDIRKYLDRGPAKKTMSDDVKKVSKPENKPKAITQKVDAAKFEPVRTEPIKPVKPKPEPVKPRPEPVKPKPEPVKAKHEKESKKPKKKAFVKWLVLLAVTVLFFTFVINISKVTVDSMAPIISSGDKAVVFKLARTYKAGDVIIFKDISGKKYIARIMADDGDVVNIDKQGGLYINNEMQEEEYITGTTTITDGTVTYPIIVGEEQFFVLGDNRTNSVDSRNSQVGLVSHDDVVGKVVYCLKGGF